METRITQLLGIRYPIIQGGMQWVGRHAACAAGRCHEFWEIDMASNDFDYIIIGAGSAGF